MAALSKLFAVATTYPYQVVRARLQDQHNKYNGIIDVITRTWRYGTDLLTAGLNLPLCNTSLNLTVVFGLISACYFLDSFAGMKAPLVSTKASSPT